MTGRPKHDYLGAERRKYIRLDSVFPVEFRLVSLDTRQIFSGWLQGFTNNIGKGGICLRVNNLTQELAQMLKQRQAKIYLHIEMPLGVSPVIALGSIAWMKEISAETANYFIGISYEQIEAKTNMRIMRYARAKKLFVPVVLWIVFILGLGFMLNTFINIKLIRSNKALVEQLVKILQESSVAKQRIKEIGKEKENLRLKIETLKTRIQTAGEEKNRTKEKRKLEQLNAIINKLIQEKTSLQDEFIALQQEENTVTEDLLRLDKRKMALEKANLDKMYQWLKLRQNLRTGLVTSLEGERDTEVQAFTYEQAMVLEVYSYFADFKRSRKILVFFSQKAKRKENIFFDAYYSRDGNPVAQNAHLNPNIWLGIAIIQYTQKTGETQFLGLAEEIAGTVISLQDKLMDSDENILDTYAFFNLLYKFRPEAQYLRARDETLRRWIKSGSVSARAVVALGPRKLEEMGVNLDRIMEAAEKGYKGGTEQTAQMALAFKIMADFYYQKSMRAKAHLYELKADKYLSELAKVDSYASVSDIAHTLFAYYKYNPLRPEE